MRGHPKDGQDGGSRSKVKVEVGSGNIFADLGLPDAEAHFLKAQIVSEIYRLAKERKLIQAQAGKLMGISQPEVSRLFFARIAKDNRAGAVWLIC